MKPQLGWFLLAILLLTSAAGAQQWKPAPVTLMTQWGEEVTPGNAWREYPRPQLVRERWQNLNGVWDYAITAKTAPAPTSATLLRTVCNVHRRRLVPRGQPFL